MNYQDLCYSCFREMGAEVKICPYCGFDNASESSPGTLPYGTILHGRYMTGRVLGVGGFGATYLVFDMKLEEKCACKEYLPSGMAVRTSDRYSLSVMRSEQRGAYEDGMEKFLDEARILARLEHVDGIVSVRDHFRENGTAYFVMRYVDGISLKEYIRQSGGRLPCEEVERIALPVMNALQQVHALQLLHRDISPDNILITKQGKPILLDFGAARSRAGENATMSVILKHGFAPQEQYSTHGNQGPWTDVYALGATMYHALTGKLPPDAIDRMHNDTIRPPSAFGVRLPAEAEQAIMKSLAVRPEDRFASMAAFSGALRAGRVQAPVVAPDRSQPEKPQQSAALNWINAHRSIVIAGAAAVVLLIIVLVVIGGRAGSRGTASSSAAAQDGSEIAGSSVPQNEPIETPQLTLGAPQDGTEQSDPPDDGGTEITGDRATYVAKDAGVTFSYLLDEAKITESTEGNKAGFANVFVDYDNVKFEIARLGADSDPQTWLQDAEEAMTQNGYTTYGETEQTASMGDRTYLFSVFQSEEDGQYCAIYATRIAGEIYLLFDYIDGSQSESQQMQFGVIASTLAPNDD